MLMHSILGFRFMLYMIHISDSNETYYRIVVFYEGNISGAYASLFKQTN